MLCILSAPVGQPQSNECEYAA